jgi:hypothetical protein
MVERIVGHLAADILPGANIEGEVNAAVDAAAPFLVGGGPESGVGAGYAREAIRIPMDLEGDCVGPEEVTNNLAQGGDEGWGWST